MTRQLRTKSGARKKLSAAVEVALNGWACGGR